MKRLAVFIAWFALLWTSGMAQDGRPDSTFGTYGRYVHNGVTSSAEVAWDMTAHVDGKVVMTGITQMPWNSQTRLSIGVMQINANGTEDAAFGQNGFVSVTDSNGTYESQVVAVQPDGKVLVGGKMSIFGVGIYAYVMRFLPNGQRDSTFGVNGLAASYFQFMIDYIGGDLAVTPSGKIILAGTVNLGNGNFHGATLQYSPQGVLDQAFGTNGMSIDMQNPYVGIVESMSLGPGGEIVTAGQDFRTGNINVSMMVAKYDSSGVPDSSFNGVGYYTFRDSIGWCNSMRCTIDQQGRILLTGSKRTFTEDTLVVTRLLPNGTLDPAFATNGRFELPNFTLLPKTIATQLDGKIVVGGYRPDTAGGNARAIRLLGNGMLDPSYGVQGITAYDFGGSTYIRAAHFDRDCNLYLGGSNTNMMGCIKLISNCPTTDVQGPRPLAGLRVRPNPLHPLGGLEIELPEGVAPDGILTLVDMQGRQVLRQAWTGGNAARIDMPAQAVPGMYVLRYGSGEFSGQVRVVVQ